MNLIKRLDYSIYEDKERANFITELLEEPEVKEYLAETDQTSPALLRQLEVLGDYILYGKNKESGQSSVDRRETYTKPKNSSFARKATPSLEEALARPSFDEREVRPLNERNSYTNPKPQILRPIYFLSAKSNRVEVASVEDDSSIPGMKELWESIDRFEWRLGINQPKTIYSQKLARFPNGEEGYRVLVSVVKGADGTLTPLPPKPPAPPLSPLLQYRLRHWLIDIKKHQFYLKAAYRPVCFASHVSFTPPTPINWSENSGYWITEEDAARLNKSIVKSRSKAQVLDLYHKHSGTLPPLLYWHPIGEHKFDFTNPLHIYALIELYKTLRVSTYDRLDSEMRHILDVFDEVVWRAELEESREIILWYKIQKWTNERILKELREFGYNYGTNYISTIYKQEICKKLARTAWMMDEEWRSRLLPEKWKRCSSCKSKKLRLLDNFANNPKTFDGFTHKCRTCIAQEKSTRRERHEEAINEEELSEV